MSEGTRRDGPPSEVGSDAFGGDGPSSGRGTNESSCDVPGWVADPMSRAAVTAACEDAGPISLTSHDLTSDHGFLQGAILADHVAALAAAVGLADDDAQFWDLRGRALRRLVIEHLARPLAAAGVDVTVAPWYDNPARAVAVDGLTNNERAVPYCSQTVTGAQVADALLAVLGGEDTVDVPHPRREPVTAGGLRALVGRQIQAQVTADPAEDIGGHLAAVIDDQLVMVGPTGHSYDTVAVIPLARVFMVTSCQLTEEERHLATRRPDSRRPARAVAGRRRSCRE